jgi:hypothetical protein
MASTKQNLLGFLQRNDFSEVKATGEGVTVIKKLYF